MSDAWVDGILESLPDAVVLLDDERRILALNPEACRLFGLSRDESRGRSIGEALGRDHPILSLVHQVLERGEASRSIQLPGPEGQGVAHLVHGRLVSGQEPIPGIVLTARNLEKISPLAGRLAHSRKLAAIGRLTSGVAHEIKNPLNALILQVALLRQKLSGTQDTKRHLDILEVEVKRLDRVIEGFLAFMRPEELQLDPVSLESVVREVLAREGGERSNVRVELELPSDLPTVQGSAGLLQQAVTNLLRNAHEAMPGGGVVRIRAAVAPVGSVDLVVEDEGEGIEPDALPKVFKLFYTTRRAADGIGLAIAYRIVQLHGGEIRIETERGKGTRVTITLPSSGF